MEVSGNFPCLAPTSSGRLRNCSIWYLLGLDPVVVITQTTLHVIELKTVSMSDKNETSYHETIPGEIFMDVKWRHERIDTNLPP